MRYGLQLCFTTLLHHLPLYYTLLHHMPLYLPLNCTTLHHTAPYCTILPLTIWTLRFFDDFYQLVKHGISGTGQCLHSTDTSMESITTPKNWLDVWLHHRNVTHGCMQELLTNCLTNSVGKALLPFKKVICCCLLGLDMTCLPILKHVLFFDFLGGK